MNRHIDLSPTERQDVARQALDDLGKNEMTAPSYGCAAVEVTTSQRFSIPPPARCSSRFSARMHTGTVISSIQDTMGACTPRAMSTCSMAAISPRIWCRHAANAASMSCLGPSCSARSTPTSTPSS